MKKILLVIISLGILSSGCNTAVKIAPSPQSSSSSESHSTVSVDSSPRGIVTRAVKIALSPYQIPFKPLGTNGYIWWITEDAKNILIRNAPTISWKDTQPPYYPSKEGGAYDPHISSIVQLFDTYMGSIGFELNKKNSSTDFDDKTFYDFIHAYQKGETVCTFVLNGDSADMSFQCSDELKKYEDEQTPYLEAITDTDVAISSIPKISGDYTVVNVNLRREGYFAVLKKEGGKYIKLYSGQEAPPCSIVDKNNVPKEIYENCYVDPSGAMRFEGIDITY